MELKKYMYKNENLHRNEILTKKDINKIITFTINFHTDFLLIVTLEKKI